MHNQRVILRATLNRKNFLYSGFVQRVGGKAVYRFGRNGNHPSRLQQRSGSLHAAFITTEHLGYRHVHYACPSAIRLSFSV
ncbi:hypothetical protein SDC9_194373 [bioreactor metagenome]|uniref:Uncharacterized protein n=1 Tax=bioreactor metagenome TaxID=1076179 RepID=A0A645I633_9ZZZZ